ncbi:MAG: serine hydroxymethyltransferase [Planctomycetes bacterium]|nr:serine hydroxymethyltransferase [Planctomycetota bacterium]
MTAPSLADSDPEVAGLVEAERLRQARTISLVASENFASRAVREAAGSVLTNKYAQGYPGARHYPDCGAVDAVEEAARTRARSLFRADHANVQPSSGALANVAVYQALLRPGESVLAMDPAVGGHETHGDPHHASGKYHRFSFYGVDASGRINLAEVRRRARAVRPRMIIAGGCLYPRSTPVGEFVGIAREAGSLLMVDMAHFAGFVAAGLHENPCPVADVVTSTTHKTLRGPRGGLILCRSAHAAAVDAGVFPGTHGGPLMHIVAAKAVAFAEAATSVFCAYQERVIANARALCEALASRGLPSVTGGTDTHMVVVDLRTRGVRGDTVEAALSRAGILSNACPVPGDPKPKDGTSGLRLGTPSVTTRGMGAEQMRRLASFVASVVEAPGDGALLERLRGEVQELAEAFPPPD